MAEPRSEAVSGCRTCSASKINFRISVEHLAPRKPKAGNEKVSCDSNFMYNGLSSPFERAGTRERKWPAPIYLTIVDPSHRVNVEIGMSSPMVGLYAELFGGPKWRCCTGTNTANSMFRNFQQFAMN